MSGKGNALEPRALQTPSFRASPVLIPFVLVFCFLSRRFGTKCAGCAQGISPSDLVRKARSKVFHLNCFTCMVCNKQLSTGEELYIIDENKFVCKDDYLSSTSLKEGSLNSGKSPSSALGLCGVRLGKESATPQKDTLSRTCVRRERDGGGLLRSKAHCVHLALLPGQ